MKYARLIAAPLLLAALAPFSYRSEPPQQNLEFRLMTIERRLDQLQSRVDVVERDQRMQSLQSTNPPTALTESLLSLQSQQISQAQQIILLQQQLLALRKQLDSMAVVEKKEEKKEEEKEKPREPVGRRRP